MLALGRTRSQEDDIVNPMRARRMAEEARKKAEATTDEAQEFPDPAPVMAIMSEMMRREGDKPVSRKANRRGSWSEIH